MELARITEDVNTAGEKDYKKCVLQFEFKERTDGVKRLKGLTEGIQWKTHVESDYSIGDDN